MDVEWGRRQSTTSAPLIQDGDVPSILETLSKWQHQMLLELLVRVILLALLAMNLIVVALDRHWWFLEPPGRWVDLILHGTVALACLSCLVSFVCVILRSGIPPLEAVIANSIVLVWLVASGLYTADALQGPSPQKHESPEWLGDLFAFRTLSFRIAYSLEFLVLIVWFLSAEALRSDHCAMLILSGLIGLVLFCLSWLLLFPLGFSKGWLKSNFGSGKLEPPWDALCLLGYLSRPLLFVFWCFHVLSLGRLCAQCAPQIQPFARRCGDAKHHRRRLLLYYFLSKRSFALILNLPFGYPLMPLGSSAAFVRGLFAVLTAMLLQPRRVGNIHAASRQLESEAHLTFNIARAIRLVDFSNEAYMAGACNPVHTESKATSRTFNTWIIDASTDTHCLVAEEAELLEAEHKLRKIHAHQNGEVAQSALQSNNSTLVVAFRGTVTWKNIETDVQVWNPGILPRRGRAFYMEDALIDGNYSPQSQNYHEATTNTGPQQPLPRVDEEISSTDRVARRGPALSDSALQRRRSLLLDGIMDNLDWQAFDQRTLARCLDAKLNAEGLYSDTVACLIRHIKGRGDHVPNSITRLLGTGLIKFLQRLLRLLMGCFCLTIPSFESFVDPRLLQHDDLERVRVHRGFLKSYLAVRNELIAALGRRVALAHQERRNLTVYFTGHSLGGALATLALLDFQVFLSGTAAQRDIQGSATGAPCVKLALYTFGAPSPGNSEFRTVFNVLAPREAFRIAARQDLITACPPPGLGFRQVACEAWLDAQGFPVFAMSWSMRWLLPKRLSVMDHPLKEYFMLLSKDFYRSYGWEYQSPWDWAAVRSCASGDSLQGASTLQAEC